MEIKTSDKNILFITFTDLLSGTYAFLSYASMIFDEAGSSMSPNFSAIIVGSIQVVGVYLSIILVDRAGRKILMVSSTFGCSLGLLIFAAYDFTKQEGVDVSDYRWIPLASFAFVIFAGNLGNISRVTFGPLSTNFCSQVLCHFPFWCSRKYHRLK